MPSEDKPFEYTPVQAAISRGIYGEKSTYPDKIYDELDRNHFFEHGDAAPSISEVKKVIQYTINDFYEKMLQPSGGSGSIVNDVYRALKKLGILKE